MFERSASAGPSSRGDGNEGLIGVPVMGAVSVFTRLRFYLPVLVAIVIFGAAMEMFPTVEPSAGQASSGTGTSSGISYPPGDAPGDAGVAASGVKCAPGVRQVTWSNYAPYCQPAFPAALSNGGSTSFGVTAKTVTITLRYAITPAEQALIGSIASGTFGTLPQETEVTNDFIKVFNENYNLYGRKLVLKSFAGQGDILAEDEGTGQVQAQADAAAAKSMGAFADLSSFMDTPPYIQALTSQQIISIGGLFDSAKLLAQSAPYEYTQGPDCEKVALESTAIVGKELQGMPAIYAGSAQLRSEKRVFGLVTPDNPMYQSCGNAEVADLAQLYHVKVATVLHYSLDLTTGADELSNMIAKMKSAGVTTVLCGCDPVTPLQYMADADQQGYHPEWIAIPYGNAFTRLPSQDQESHDISANNPTIPKAQEESNAVLELSGDPNASKLPAALVQGAYAPMLMLFDGIQAAGPDLTPQTFQAGLDSLPTSGTQPESEYGVWKFSPGMVDPAASFEITRWDPNATALDDGLKGAFVPCNGGAQYLISTANSVLPRRQIQCPAVS